MSASVDLFEKTLAAPSVVRLAEEDPALFERLPASARADAHAHAIAPAFALPRGPLEDPALGVDDFDSCVGVLILDGLVVHSIVVATEPRSEVVGPGDVIRPWQLENEFASIPFSAGWSVVHPARVALLDQRVLAFAARWPQLMITIVERTIRRSRWLALQLAITDLRRVDERLLLFFWHLADRWGKVRRDGVLLPLPVTHDVLAQLVCAQRPTVTSSLRRLSDAGQIRRLSDRSWLLNREAAPNVTAARARLAAATA
jgi:CRP/FNR family transcriptional regulator, cyclic AMP receptor protein